MHYLEEIAFRHPTARLIEDQSQALIQNIKKNQRRIDKAKTLLKGTETSQNTLLFAETRAKILKWEQVISRNVMLLKQRNGEKQKIDEREMTKFERKQKEDQNKIIRLEKGKIIDLKETNQVSHMNDPKRKIILSVNRTGKSQFQVDREKEEELIRNYETRKNFLEENEKQHVVKPRQKATKKKKTIRNYGSNGYGKTYFIQENKDPV